MKFVYRIGRDLNPFTVRSGLDTEDFLKKEFATWSEVPRYIWQREAGINNPWKCVFDRERDERVRKFKSL